MHINYVTSYDLYNPASWPKYHLGLYTAGSYIVQGLQHQGLTLENIAGDKRIKLPWTRLKWLMYRRLFHKDYYSWLEPLLLNYTAYQINRKLQKATGDLVLCTENMLPLYRLKTDCPVVLWTDTTLASLINFYPHLSNLCRETEQRIYQLESRNLQRCHKIIFTSDWAAKTALEIYNLNPQQVQVIPWGANLESDRDLPTIQDAIAQRPPHPCKLLFVGVDWQRKGGDLAFKVAEQLNQQGLATELITVGCKPPMHPLPSFVKVIGYIDKSTPTGLKEFEQLLAASHFLILPTKADCSPHVLIEANSFGVPCIATAVGGIATIVQEDNGETFSPQGDSQVYCDYIMEIMRDRQRYEQLALSAFQAYQTRLNWQVVTQQATQVIQQIK